MLHKFSQNLWWTVVQYPELTEDHPKCSCGATLKVKSHCLGMNWYNYTLYCPIQEAEKQQKKEQNGN